MSISLPLRAAALFAAVTLVALPLAAQDTSAPITTDEVRAEISAAMDAIAAYTEQERDRAIAEARETLDRVDAEIERREEALRESWADMSETARETARARLQDLRKARNRLGERYGALESGTSSAWDELKNGFSDAWNAFSDAWTAADDEAEAK